MPRIISPMINRFFPQLISVIIIIQSFWLSTINSSIIPPPPAFNLSHFLYPKVTTFIESNIPSQPPNFLQGVLEAIARKERLALENIRVLELDVKKVKYSSVQRYEFRVRVGKTEILLKMYEKVSEWNKLVELREHELSDFEALARRINAKPVIDSFKIEGPFELQVSRDDDRLSLALPLNTSYSGLRRISVGEGITVEVKGAEEISLFNPSDRHHLPYSFPPYRKSKANKFFWPAVCTSLRPIRIIGSPSVFAYRNKRPSAHIKTVFSSKKAAIKLLPEKCYARPEKPKHIFNSLGIRVSLLEKVLRNLLNETDTSLGSLKTRIKSSTLFRFQLGLEKDIRSNDTYWSTLAEWRTRPIIERIFFEVVARMEGEVMKPQIIKKVRPFLDSDSFTWNSLLSNLSFTKFPSGLVPPEALTLDVKW